MATLAENKTNAQKWLTARTWLLDGENDATATDFKLRIVTRRITEVPGEILDALTAYLNDVGTTYVDPQAGGKKLEGTWTAAPCEKIGVPDRNGTVDHYDVRQTLVTGDGMVKSFTIPDVDGTVTVTRVEGKTAAALQAILTALSASYSNAGTPSFDAASGRWGITLHITSPASRATYFPAYSKTGLVRYIFTAETDEAKHRIEVKWTVTYNVKRNVGTDAGWAAFNALKPISHPGCGAYSRFSPMSGDVYEYEAITSLSRTASQASSSFQNGTTSYSG